MERQLPGSVATDSTADRDRSAVDVPTTVSPAAPPPLDRLDHEPVSRPATAPSTRRTASVRQTDTSGGVIRAGRMTLAGLGTALPPFAIQQEHAARIAVLLATTWKHQRALPTLYQFSGVKQRYSVVLEQFADDMLPEQTFYPTATDPSDRGPTTAQRMRKYEEAAIGLAESACRNAFANAAATPQEITHVVTVSCSGFTAPGIDLSLVERLGLSREIERIHVGFMGCHGALNGLRVAQGCTATRSDACVLLCAVELCSLHHQYTDDPEQLVANALFADGAAALIARPSDGNCHEWQLTAQASTILPGTSDMMSWRIGDHGFEMSLSPRVPEVIHHELKPWLANWLSHQGLSIDRIRSWAIHPGGPRILSAVSDALGLTAESLATSRKILETHGNMSSPTVLFILQQLWRSPDNSPCVMLAFGPGLTIEAALLHQGPMAP